MPLADRIGVLQGVGVPVDLPRPAAAAENAGRSLAPALPCDDVDTPEDLRGLNPAPESATAAYLRQIGVMV